MGKVPRRVLVVALGHHERNLCGDLLNVPHELIAIVPALGDQVVGKVADLHHRGVNSIMYDVGLRERNRSG